MFRNITLRYKHNPLPSGPTESKRTGSSWASQQVHKVVSMIPNEALNIPIGTVLKNQAGFSTLNIFCDGPNKSNQIRMAAQVRHDFQFAQ